MTHYLVHKFCLVTWVKIGFLIGFLNTLFAAGVLVLIAIVYSVNVFSDGRTWSFLAYTLMIPPLAYGLFSALLNPMLKFFCPLTVSMDYKHAITNKENSLNQIVIAEILPYTLQNLAYRLVPFFTVLGFLYLIVRIVINPYDLNGQVLVGIPMLFVCAFCFPFFWARPLLNWVLRKIGGHSITGSFSVITPQTKIKKRRKPHN